MGVFLFSLKSCLGSKYNQGSLNKWGINYVRCKKIKPLILSSKNILIVFHGNSCRALLMKILNISQKKIINLEIPTGNPLLIRFENNLQVKDYKYLDKKRARKILFNI